MARTFYTSHFGIIQPGQRIGAGGEGEVFDVQGRADLVAKLYLEKPAVEKAEKLIALARLGTERLLKLSAWPVDVLRNAPDGDVVGFVMKKIEQAEEVHTLHSPKSRLQKFPEASWAFLLYVAANIARAVAAMHEHGFVIGDLNPKNILVTRKATVYLLDCDSFQVTAEGRTWRCEAGFPEYTPPELQGAAFREFDRRPEHDYFGLAIVIFQLLFIGRHPFSGRFSGAGEMSLERAIRELRFAYGIDAESRQMQPPPGTLSLGAIPQPLSRLFRHAFLATSPGDRPAPRQWIEPLESLAKSLRKCELHSGHFYFQELPRCPWCEIESRARIRLFNFMLAGADGARAPFRLDEIWKEVEAVPPPYVALVPMEDLRDYLSPSEEVAAFARRRKARFFAALAFVAVAGFGVSWVGEVATSLGLLAMTLVAATRIAKLEDGIHQVRTLFHSYQLVPDDPLIDQIQERKRQAEDSVRQLEERWEKEAGSERYLAKLKELQTRKESYADLAQVRERKLRQLETEARKEQLEAFLDQFEVEEADLGGVWFKANSDLYSHGVETAADVNERKLKQIPSVGTYHLTKLLEWRRGLEQQFEFNRTGSVSQQAWIAAEKEIDEIRHRLEYELSGGAFYLRRVKQEVEARQRQLQPALANARQALVQAEKDWEAAIKRHSLAPIIAVLIGAFLLGWLFQPAVHNAREDAPVVAPSESGEAIKEPPPRPVTNDADAPRPTRKEYDEARRIYLQGVDLSKKGKYREAAGVFRKAIAIDPGSWLAHEELAYALYRLGEYDQSIEASKQAIGLNNSFASYYCLGLNYVARKNWGGAKTALQFALYYRDKARWEPRYSDAYHNMALAVTRLGEARESIEVLKQGLRASADWNTDRFELANLYLWTGNYNAAKAQYRILKESDEMLAEELRKLMLRHGVR